MKISDNCVNLIKKFEGCILKAYKCPAGVWTIGYGTTIYPNGNKVKQGDTCTTKQAAEYLKNDISKKFEPNVDKYNSIYHFTQNQYDALVSFAYNIGSIDALTAKGTRTVDAIATKILAYNKASGKILAGLTKRRTAEMALFNTSVTSISKSSSKLDIAWMQSRLNKINVGLTKLAVDGQWGAKTTKYIVAVCKMLNWTPCKCGTEIHTRMVNKLKNL